MKRKIFIEGKNPNERAYIGWQNESLSLFGVKEGYKNSADDLVDIAIREGNKGAIKILDTYVFPIIFLYRHSIEVSLKFIYLRALDEIPKGGHNLLTLWDKVEKDVINCLQDEKKLEELSDKNNTKIEKLCFEPSVCKEIKILLKELQGEDSKGDVWRYLINTEGSLYFTEWDFIDYKNLKESINYIYDILDELYYRVDYILQ